MRVYTSPHVAVYCLASSSDVSVLVSFLQITIVGKAACNALRRSQTLAFRKGVPGLAHTIGDEWKE